MISAVLRPDLAHEVGHQRHALAFFPLLEEPAPALKIHLEAVDVVALAGLQDQAELALADLRPSEVERPGEVVLRIPVARHGRVGRADQQLRMLLFEGAPERAETGGVILVDVVHAQRGPELHATLVRPRGQQLDDVHPLIEQRPGAVGHPFDPFQPFAFRPLGHVGAVDLAELGGVGEGLVAAAHRVGEHFDRGIRGLLDVPARLLGRHRRRKGDKGRRVAIGIVDQARELARSARLLVVHRMLLEATGSLSATPACRPCWYTIACYDRG